MYTLFVEAWYLSEKNDNKPKMMRADKYFIKDFTDILTLREVDSLPVTDDVLVKLRNGGKAQHHFSERFWFNYKIKDTDKRTIKHYARLAETKRRYGKVKI